MKKKRILAADRPAGTQTIVNILGEEFEVVTAESFVQAENLLDERWDLILCGIHFDDSRMFDFAETLARRQEVTKTPFFIFRDLDSELDTTFFRSLKISAEVIGAAAFIDLFSLKLQHGLEKADQMFRTTIIQVIDEAWGSQ